MTALLLLAVLIFCTGASITRLITKDGLFEAVRDRWYDHFTYRQDTILAPLERGMDPLERATYENQPHDEKRLFVLRLVGKRAAEEKALPLTVRGKRREVLAPYTVGAARLGRQRMWTEFIGCPWCVGFWVYLVAWVVAWPVVLGWGFTLHGLGFWVWWLPLALSFRWLNGLVATLLD
jgi:hypothetical protein